MESTRYTFSDFLEDIAALGRNGQIVVEHVREWLSHSYGGVELDIINLSRARFETVLVVKAAVSICRKEGRFVDSAEETLLEEISAIAERHGLKPTSDDT